MQPLNVEQKIVLNKFQLRWYQEDIYDAVMQAIQGPQNPRKFLLVGPRRMGKDILFWNLAIRQCLAKTCLVYYVLPTYGQARKAIWQAIASNGVKFLDYIPTSLIDRTRDDDMQIRFVNGSILQCIGGDSYNTSLVGTNPYALIFSEYSRMTEKAWEFARPIIAANGGWAAFISTPFGKNHFYYLYQVAQTLKDWKIFFLKTSDINHISAEVLEQERAQMSEGLYLQEFECDFSRGVEGSYYGKALEKLRQNGQITTVPWEPGLLVHVAIDIGVNDATTIIFFQVAGHGTVIRIIDCYSNTNLGLDHYAKYLQDKPYRYGKYFAPHDLKVREWGGGAITRYEKARQLGIDFVILPQTDLMDGIENVWTHFPKLWIDENKCRSLVNALENYRREWDEERGIYKSHPVKSWACHYADALRYLCMALPKTEPGRPKEDYDRARAQALYGGKNSNLPRFFRDDIPYNSFK